VNKFVERKGRPIEILLVEDNPADVRLTIEGLKEAKVHNNLQTASDGAVALDILFRRGQYNDAPRPDLVLLDLNLPGIDGREVLELVKSDLQLKTIPVVILTSSESESDILKTYQLHANCYVSKPVAFEAFTRVVQSIDQFWFEIVKLP
jgi:two-component system, chemotaxis family, response regulator Rcp1